MGNSIMTTHNQFDLMRDRRFLPLFITQFLGAAHDNIFKNTLIVLILFSVVMGDFENPSLLITLAAGIFILPFGLISAIGGELADKYDKDKIIRALKIAELGIAAIGIASIFSGSIILAFCALFALGAQSAIFSPSKYSLLPQHLKDYELIGGNALLNTGTFLAILLGTILGSTMALMDGGKIIVSVIMATFALTGYISSRFIPKSPPSSDTVTLNLNPITSTIKVLKNTFSSGSTIVLSMLGVGWFYFLGGVFMAQLPAFTKGSLGGSEGVLALLLVLFSIGVAIGGLINNRILRGRIEATYVPLAAIAISILSFDLYSATHLNSPSGDELTIIDFILSLSGIRVIFDLFLIALAGGLFVVPLNAIIQLNAPEKAKARVMAGSAITNALFGVASAVLTAVLLVFGFSIPQIFAIMGAVNVLVAIYICKLIPQYLIKSIVQIVAKLLWRVEVKGAENLENAGEKAVIVANHVSMLDAPLLAAFLPNAPIFAINSDIANLWWVRPWRKMANFFPMDTSNPFAIKELIKKVDCGNRCIIFPEGRLTETGSLMKVYEGPGMIADKASAPIVPVRVDGVQNAIFANRLKGKVKGSLFPKITITILPPQNIDLPDDANGRKRREITSVKLYDIMENMMFKTNERDETLFSALISASHVNGKKSIIAEDITRKSMSIEKLLLSSKILGEKLSKNTNAGDAVGIMLPSSLACLASFFALQYKGRVCAMLNFSAGTNALLSACKTSGLNKVITSRVFIEKGSLEKEIAEISKTCEVVYLEDVKKSINILDKLKAALSITKSQKDIKTSDAAVILFTSGSEGQPKAVVLSHKNLMTNIVQLSSRVDFDSRDVVFNCLPMFHSFGLTGGALLPILNGVKTFLYPSPLHYRIIPELIYHSNATIMFGADTFLAGYARMANEYDFYRMRYIFAGAERVQEKTREIYMERFGVRILEGYGATETAPVISVNSSMHCMAGSVGRFLAGMDWKLEPVEGVDVGGRLFVRGDNVMLGYFMADKPCELAPPKDGWHDTGDIVSVDDKGFVKILGRAKRFAKIAGEMVSLASAESLAFCAYPDDAHCVIAIEDEKKGQALILLTTAKNLKRGALSEIASKQGISALSVPSKIKHVEEIPLLATGKVDYKSAQELCE